jgi:hypothetical protein
MESDLKMKGEYEEYERNMILNNARYTVKNIESGLEQFLDDMINESYAMEDGTIQNWSGNGIDRTEVKQFILDKLQKIKDITEN